MWHSVLEDRHKQTAVIVSHFGYAMDRQFLCLPHCVGRQSKDVPLDLLLSLSHPRTEPRPQLIVEIPLLKSKDNSFCCICHRQCNISWLWGWTMAASRTALMWVAPGRYTRVVQA